MKLTLFIKILIFTMIGFLYSCNKENAFDCVKSTGKIDSRIIESDKFHSISVHDNIDLVIKQGVEKQVNLTAGRNIMPKIRFEVRDEVLYITNDNSCNWVRKFQNPKVHITLEELTTLYHNGYGNITSEGTLNLQKIDIQNIEGNGDVIMDLNVGDINIFSRTYAVITLTGKADNLNLNYVYNYGRFQGQQLEVENITINHLGLNTLHVFPIQLLDVSIGHSGNIAYYNEPETMTSQISSNGQLIKSF